MRLNSHLWCLVLATLVPTASVTASLTLSLYDPTWPAAMALVLSLVGLMFGGYLSLLIARGLRQSIEDLAVEAGMLSREMPTTRVHPPVQELDEIARSLAEAGARVRQAHARRDVAHALFRHAETALEIAYRTATRGEWEWDLESGEVSWSAPVNLLFRTAPDTHPSRAALLGMTHPGDRTALATWLGRLCRGEESAPLEFRIIRGNGEPAAIRASGTIGRDEIGRPLKITGLFEDVRDGASEAPDLAVPAAA
jgi:PAS domain-containing protein